MTSYKKLKKKLLAHKIVTSVLVFCCVVGIGGIAFAFNSNSQDAPKVVVEGDYVEAPALEGDYVTKDELEDAVENVNFGAVTSPYLPGPDFAIGNLNEFVVSRDFIDASTTIFAAHSPFLTATSSATDVVVLNNGRFGYTVATTSVDLMALDILTSVAGGLNIDCESAPTRYATSTGNLSLLTATGVTSTPYLENNITAANADGGYLTGTVAKIFLTPQRPYLICKVHGSYANLATVTSTSNVFDGVGAFRARKLSNW